MSDLEKLKKEIALRLPKISFDHHAITRSNERKIINPRLIKRMLHSFNKYLHLEINHNYSPQRYKLWIRLSNSYSLVLILELHESIHIVTGWIEKHGKK